MEIQLKVWKELAISKQVLMRGAAEALKLDPECSQDELKIALEETLRKIAKADADVVAAREQARVAVAEIEKTLTLNQRLRAAAEATVAELRAEQEKLAREMAIERAAAAQELQKAKERVAEKDKALKAINTALADTPENVLKKMNTLKKQKQDEADARRDIEASLGTLRKEKQTQDKLLAGLRENSTKLLTQHRELHATSLKLHEQLLPLAKEREVPAVPELDAKLLESIENPDAKPEPKAEGKPEKGVKKK
jgi:colicin import membrane protein